MEYCGFDIEVDGLADSGMELSPTCIGLWKGGAALCWPESPAIGGVLDYDGAILCLRELWKIHKDEGRTLVSFNGTSFDWAILASYVPEWKDRIIEMVWDHVDLMLIVVAQKGFPVSLNAMAQAMLGETKLDGIKGEHAPEMWLGSLEPSRESELFALYNLLPGSGQARALMLRYVASDARLTAKLAAMIDQTKQITWITQKGRYSSFPLFIGRDITSLRVSELSKLPAPDTSWMTRAPMVTLESATAWMRE